MNLVTRILLLFAVVSLLVFLAGGVISYQVMQREVDLEQQRFLSERLERWTTYLSRRAPTDTLNRNQLVVIPLKESKPESVTFSDTLVMHSQLERLEPHLKLSAIRNINNRSYAITMYGVVVESDDIVDAVTESLIKMYLILLAVILPIGGIASYILLRPFQLTLDVIKNFSLQGSNQKTSFPKSSVAEFKKLNRFLEQMTTKVRRDYSVLKEFSENASHELQTPIAIMQSKLEVLMEGENLSEEQLGQIIQTQNVLRRLRNLSTSLGILTKIDNREFNEIKTIDISTTVSQAIEEFRELMSLKSIQLHAELVPKVMVKSDRTLLELLISNLINNAIRHNYEGGYLNIFLRKDALIIENSGHDLDIDPSQLFNRFKKSNQSEVSIGLGLAIVKRVCERNSFDISYNQANEKHVIKVAF